MCQQRCGLFGERVNSGPLRTWRDALFDAILTPSSVLAAALYTGVSLEAYVGVLISVFIKASGRDAQRLTIKIDQ